MHKVAPLKIIRYGTSAEQKFIDNFKNDFDLLVINGNMISHASKAISQFVATRKFSYIIDPLTHSLQHDIQYIKGKNNKIKNSIKKMVENYSEFVSKKIIEEEKVLVPSDFTDDSILKEFTYNVLDFQKNHVIESSKERDFYKYLLYAKVTFEPRWLIVPYFMMNTKNYKKWLEINIKMVEFSLEKFSTDKLGIQIVIEKDILEENFYIEELIEKYSSFKIKNIFLWIDDFSAFESSRLLLKNFCELIKGFSNRGINVYNLYGDYFSILLCHEDSGVKLKGVCHGIEYGEKRAIVPVGGGIPVNKYYLFPIHQRVEYGRVATLLTYLGILPHDYNRYYDEICDCQQCKEVIRNNMDNFKYYGDSKTVEFKRKTGATISRQYPTTEAKSICINHFLFNKLKEWEFLNNNNLKDLLDQTINSAKAFSPILGYDLVATFELWKEVLCTDE